MGRCVTALLAATIVAAASPMPAPAQRVQVDVAQLITDLQRQTPRADAITSVWWMPTAFWEATFRADSSLGRAEVDEILAVLTPYTLVAVVDGSGAELLDTVPAMRSHP